jgi:hypothetical protein
VAERVSASDPTSRHIWTQKFEKEERRADRGKVLPRRWIRR